VKSSQKSLEKEQTSTDRDVDVDSDRRRLECGYGEKWIRTAGLIKLLIRKFSEE